MFPGYPNKVKDWDSVKVQNSPTVMKLYWLTSAENSLLLYIQNNGNS